MRLLRWFAVLCLAGTAWAQIASDISAEPHHSLLLQNDAVRVYSLVLRPHEQSYVRHDHNFLLLTLQESDLVIWPEGASDITSFHLVEGRASFQFSGRAQGIRNPMTSTYRGVVVEFLDPKVTTYGYQPGIGEWDFGYSSLTSPVDPHARFSNTLPLGTASASDDQLLPGDALPASKNGEPALLVAVTTVNLHASDGSQIQKSPGDAVWIPARKLPYSNAGDRAARFLLIEFSRAGFKD